MKITDYRNRIQQDPEYIAVEKELKPFLILANNVLRFRLENGWSQSELARQVGTKQTNISRIESGLSNPTTKFLLRLAKAFNVEIYQLFQEESSVTDQPVSIAKEPRSAVIVKWAKFELPQMRKGYDTFIVDNPPPITPHRERIVQ